MRGSTTMDQALLRQIIKTRNDIKKKYKAIKLGRAEAELQMEETFRPITKPLKELVKKEHQFPEIKTEKFEPLTPKNEHFSEEGDSYEDANEMLTPTPYTSRTSRKSLFNSERKHDADLMDNFLIREGFGDLAKKYLGYITRTPNKVDRSRGVRKTSVGDSELELKIGNSKMTISGDDIIIKNKTYKGTPGLYELIFMKSPKGYTDADIAEYGQVLNTTSAHRRNYEEDEQITGTNGNKYKNIIKGIIATKKKEKEKHNGDGLMSVNTRKIEHVYWDDPNELIERLSLLQASQRAGHNNHHNEIMSIMEELREAELIL